MLNIFIITMYAVCGLIFAATIYVTIDTLFF